MKEKKEKATPIRKVIYLRVVLSKGRVYKIPIEGTPEIEIRKLTDFNTLRRILTPLIHIYYNVCAGTKLKYEDFGAFLMDLEHLGYEVFEEYYAGILELVEVNPITNNDQELQEIKNGTLISLRSQELSERLASNLKKAIHEIFEEEKKKQEPGSSFMESQKSSIIKEAIYLLTPQLP